MKRKIFTLALALATTLVANAIPAKRGIWRTMQLPNGTEVKVELRGDEFMSFWQDASGNRYTVDAQNRLRVADMDQLRQINKELRTKAGNVAGDMRRVKSNAKKMEYKGDKRCLIILAQFSDKKFSMADPKAFYTRVANEKGFSENGFMGSVSDYFSAQSGGQFNITFDVVGPYTLGSVKSYGENVTDTQGNRLYDKNAEGMITGACGQAHADGLDFSPYDWDDDGFVEMVYVVYAGEGEATGGGAETIWPHKSQLPTNPRYGNKRVSIYACSNEVNGGNKLAGIGTICHEFSHCMGYPDVYDIEYGGNYGMGTWDLMCSGSYNGDTYCPAGYTAYEKMVAGWINPVELTENASYSDIKTTADGGDAYIFYHPENKDEYYLIENRQRKGWDKYIAAGGILVNHITYDKTVWDYNMPNTFHKGINDIERITIIPADNKKTSTTEASDVFGTRDNYRQLTNATQPADVANTENASGSKVMNISLTKMNVTGGLASFTFTNHNLGTGVVDGYVLYETFDQALGTGGNDNKFKPSSKLDANFATGTLTTDVPGWSGEYLRGGSQCLRVGKNGGSDSKVTTPEFTLNGEAKLTFRAAAWNDGSGTTLKVSASNGSLANSEFTMPAGAWGDFSTTVKGNGKMKLTFQGELRYFLDQVFVTDPGTTGIENVEMNNQPAVKGVYSIDGRYLGNDVSKLGKGLYIVNGKKIVK